MLRKQLDQHILIFDGDVLLKSNFRVEFPADSVLICDYQDEACLFFNRLAIDLAIDNELVGWHFVLHKQLGTIYIAA